MKINRKKYLLFALIMAIPALFFSKNYFEVLIILSGIVLVLWNHFLFVKGLEGLFELALGANGQVKKSKIYLLFLRKIIFFAGIFFLGVQFLGSKVMIIVVFYILQTLVLVYAKEG